MKAGKKYLNNEEGYILEESGVRFSAILRRINKLLLNESSAL